MPWSRPPLTKLRDDALADVTASDLGLSGLLRFAATKVLAVVVANAANGHYGYIDNCYRQSTPWTAVDEALLAWGALKGVFLKSPNEAQGSVTFNGSIGARVPAGFSIVRGDGFTYTTDAAVTLDGSGLGTVAATASLAAAAGDCDAGTVLTLGQAVVGVNSGAVAATDFTGGADLEDMEDYRTRVLQAFSEPPQGGADSDYCKWALEVPGVTRAWVPRPSPMGVGTVCVYAMLDLAQVAHAGLPQGVNGVATDEPRSSPATGDQLAIADYIYDVQPVTALVYAMAPTANTVDFTIAGLSTAKGTVKAAIRAAITDVFFTQGAPGGTVELSYIEAAVAAVPGATGFVITAVVCSNGSTSPANGNIASAAGALPFLGTATFP